MHLQQNQTCFTPPSSPQLKNKAPLTTAWSGAAAGPGCQSHAELSSRDHGPPPACSRSPSSTGGPVCPCLAGSRQPATLPRLWDQRAAEDYMTANSVGRRVQQEEYQASHLFPRTRRGAQITSQWNGNGILFFFLFFPPGLKEETRTFFFFSGRKLENVSDIECLK